MEDFYLTLMSNSSINIFPNNKLSEFTNILNPPIALLGQWKVGITEIYFNRVNISNRKEQGYVSSEFEKNVSNDLQNIRLNLDKAIEITNTSTQNQTAETNSLKDFLYALYDPVQALTSKMKEENKLDITINNHNNDFINQALIYTDIIESRHIGDQFAKCLKIVPIALSRSYIKFETIEYYPLASNILRDISILIKDGSGENLNFYASNLPTFCINLYNGCICIRIFILYLVMEHKYTNY